MIEFDLNFALAIFLAVALPALGGFVAFLIARALGYLASSWL